MLITVAGCICYLHNTYLETGKICALLHDSLLLNESSVLFCILCFVGTQNAIIPVLKIKIIIVMLILSWTCP